jgi:hypothetical protein
MPAKKNGKQSYTAESLDIDWHTARSRPRAQGRFVSKKSASTPAAIEGEEVSIYPVAGWK